MKFKPITLTVALALMLSLAGCNKSEKPNSSNDSTSISSQTNATESTKSVESTESADSEPLSNEVKKFLEKYPSVAEYVGRDGKIIPTSKIVSVDFGSEEEVRSPTVAYNLSYITYGIPCYADTLDGSWKTEGDYSTIYDWISDRRDKAEKNFANSEFIMVKPGDKLENGLVVKSAKLVYYALTPEEEKELKESGAQFGGIASDLIEFDGTLTLEGMLFRYTADPDYFEIPNDVFFYPNTTKNKFVPMWNNDISDVSFDSDIGMVSVGSYFLGNPDKDGVNMNLVDEALGEANYAYVKITLENFRIGGDLLDNGGSRPQRADIVNIERID